MGKIYQLSGHHPGGTNLYRKLTSTDWVENFCMSRQTFQYLCQKMGPLISLRDTPLCKCVFVDKHVNVTLWCQLPLVQSIVCALFV